MTFPVESVPDGDPTGPHHLYIGLLMAGFAFWAVWQYYPVVGASGTLLGLLVALDDAISHAFGVPTPLDLLWAHWIHPYMM